MISKQPGFSPSIKEIDFSDETTLQQVEAIEDAIRDQQEVIVPWVNEPAFTLGAEVANHIIGVVQVSTDGHLNYIVHPEYQGKGIATQLLDLAVSLSKQRGIPKLIASVAENSASQRVLEKKGFVFEHSESRKLIYGLRLDF